MLRSLRHSFLCLLAICFAGATAFAQNASISEKSTDPDGAAMVGAQVQIISRSAGTSVSTTSDKAGMYQVRSLETCPQIPHVW